MPSASLPPWAAGVSVPGGKLVGCVEAGGIAVAIRKQRGHANLLLEVLMRNGNKRPARPVDSGTRDIGRATEHAVALAAELTAQAGLADVEPVVQPPTYGQLLEAIGRRGTNAQNRKSQLRSWMRIFGFVEDDEIGDEFGAALDIYLDKFRAALEAQGKAPSTVGPYLSRIREIRSISLELRRVEVSAPTFASVLSAAIKASRVPVARVAQVAQVYRSVIYSWCNGQRAPTADRHEQIVSVEVLLGLPPGVLMELVMPARMGRQRSRRAFAVKLRSAIEQSGKTVKDVALELGCRPKALREWLRGTEPSPSNRALIPQLENILTVEQGTLLSSLSSGCVSWLKYAIELNARQKQEWDCLFEHKTNRAQPDTDRRPEQYWRIRADGRCPTGAIQLGALTRFYGCLSLPVDAEDSRLQGLGIPADSLSLLNYAVRKHVEFLVNFHAKRSGGLGTSTRLTIMWVLSLLREGTGFLWQGNHIDWRLFPVEWLEPEVQRGSAEMTLERWRAHCVQVHRRLSSWLKHLASNGLLKKHRNYAHIDAILKMERPTRALVLLEKRMKRHVARRWQRLSPKTRARAIRDLVFVQMIAPNPLRAEQWDAMTFETEEQPGHLRKGADGNYYLHIPEHEFKAGADSRDCDYEAAVAPSLTPLIDDYLANYRPLLLGAEMCNLFFRPGDMRNKPGYVGRFSTASMAVRITNRYLPDYCTRGFGTHAWRHIIATHLVKNHDSGIRLAAHALHNTEKMIERHYGHLRSRDRTDRSQKIIDAELAIDREQMEDLF